MELTDLLWLMGIVAGTAWLLLRNFRARRTGCAGCSASGCSGAKRR